MGDGAKLLETAREEILALHRQLTNGCGRAACTRPHCASNPHVGRLEANAALARAVALVADGSGVRCPPAPPLLTAAQVEQLANAEDTTEGAPQSGRLVAALHAAFSQPDALSQSFLLEGEAALASPEAAGIDAAALARAYAVVQAHAAEGVRNSLLYASQAAVASLRLASSLEPLDRLRALLVLLLNPLLAGLAWHRPVLAPLVAVVCSWREELRETLARWVLALPLTQARQTVNTLQSLVTMRILASDAPQAHGDDDLGRAAALLQLLYDENVRLGESVLGYQDFYNDVLNEWLNERENGRALVVAYMAWRREADPFPVCAAPAVLSPQTKSKLLHYASLEEQGRRQSEAVQRMLVTGAGVPYFLLAVERDQLVPTTLARIAHALARNPLELKKELRVKFVGEEGVDEGGVQKEFFQLIVRQLFDARYGMFVLDERTRTYWFSSSSMDDAEFELIGTVLGLALYNGVILDVHFPFAVYKKLMGAPLSWHDLRDTQPAVHDSLARLLAYGGNVEEDLDLTFQVSYDYFGEMRHEELVEGGAALAVTAANRRRFVDLYAHWLLERSVERQFQAFVKGFRHVCDGLFFQLFRPEEVELLVCGDPVLDFHDLQRAVYYDNGYSAEHPVIQRFWKVVHSMTEEEQRRFLFFATGSDRSPIGGLGQLKFVVVRHGEDSDHLPQAHTCFNALLLPEYATEERMRDRLLLAINNAEGFGML